MPNLKASTTKSVGIEVKLDQVKACIHCGMCLSSCPTYLVTGNEGNSPRGRLYLIRDLIEENKNLTSEGQEYLDNCLSCLACETACPSGVEYSSILEYARDERQQISYQKGFLGFIRKIGFKYFLPNRKLMRFFRLALKFLPKLTKIQPKFDKAYKKISENSTYNSKYKLAELLKIDSGISFLKLRMNSRIAELKANYNSHEDEMGFMSLIEEAQEFLNSVTITNSEMMLEATHSNILNIIDELRIVSLPLGCVMDTVYNHVHWDTIKILNGFGFHVYIPSSNCCGALAAHSGEYKLGYKQLEETASILAENYYPVVMNSAGCGAFLKDHADPSIQSFDLIEAINKAPLSFEEFSKKLKTASKTLDVTYHPACHLNHAQGIKTEYLDLLKLVPGLQIRSLHEADICCGSAGFYNLIKPEMAEQIGQRKADFIRKTGSNILVTANPGCMSQIEAHLENNYKVMHPVTLISEFLE